MSVPNLWVDYMNKTMLIAFTLALSISVFGQITTTKVAPKVEISDPNPYDGTRNFLGEDVRKYVGQELYLKGVAESLRKYGYSNFVNDYTKGSLFNNSNVYKCCDSYNSKYDALTGKYFKVLDVIRHPKALENGSLYGKKYFLKLQEKESGDTVYFEYDTPYEHSFPFIVVAFFEKQKQFVAGKEFVFSDLVLKGSTDIKTGKVVTIKTGQKWKCSDLTVEEKFFSLSLVITNPVGETTTISYDGVFGKWRYGQAYTAEEADAYRSRLGSGNFDTILQGKIRLGMTMEMCRLSWGEPKSINETISALGKTAQWVYSDNYLYFTNGILTTMQ